MNNGHKTYYIKTFGCQMNEHDSTKMASLLEEDGFAATAGIKDADIILFNTCTVRAKPHHKAISEVGRALKIKRKKPHLIVGIAGCVAQEEKKNLFKIFPALDIVIGPDQIFRLKEMVDEVLRARAAGVSTSCAATKLIDNYEDYNFINTPSSNSKLLTTSFVTIMKGCNNFCTFCIVPYVRGREVSKSPDEILGEVNRLVEGGVKEIMLLGQNVNSYGNDNRSFGTFSGLLSRIADETEIKRIRYTSPHPKDLSDALIKEHQTNKKLCENIHLPLQAGSTSVLKKMNRRYSREDYLSLVGKIKALIPGVAITTDLIVGFPGETDDDFAETLEVMKNVEFDGIFAFKYSERGGTRAAEKFPDDVPFKIKKERLAQVLNLNEKIVLQKHQKYVGTRPELLVEGASKRGGGQLSGRTRTNKVVNFEGNANLTGKLVEVLIESAGLNSLKGSFEK